MLGKLRKVDLREVWNHEAHDFTNWLVKPENIQLLSDEIGMSIEPTTTEMSVGGYFADVLAEEEITGDKIVIENQLEMTNHDHLGKIITYASGLDANYVIWIFKDIREEHRQAIDWLNEITGEEINFFAIKLEVWKIGDSPPAPKFNVICSPNNWAKSARTRLNDRGLNDTQLKQLEFWQGFREFLVTRQSPFNPRKARAKFYYNLSIDCRNAHLANTISYNQNFLRVEIYIGDNKDLYHYLHERKIEIEKETKMSLEWLELPDAKASRIQVIKAFVDFEDESQYYSWLFETDMKFYKAFHDRIKNFS